MDACPSCGALVAPGTLACPACGTAIARTAPVAAGPAGARQRPTGITILGVLAFVLGGAAVVGGVLAFLFFTLLGASIGAMFGMGDAGGGFGALLGVTIAVVALVFGGLYLLLGWGIWNGRPWAWVLGLVLAVLSLVSWVMQALAGFGNREGALPGFGAGLPSALLAGFVLWYFLQPGVKAWFGRA